MFLTKLPFFLFRKKTLLGLTFLFVFSSAESLLVPMDEKQANHLKAYGLAFAAVKAGVKSSWLLNYRCGSFLFSYNSALVETAGLRGITVVTLSDTELAEIRVEIQNQNECEVKLEKAPRIAVYTPPNNNPWADAVTEVLTYAEIPFDKIYDREVLTGSLSQYDWLHLHHEDFTGQYGKFWANYQSAPWYLEKVATFEREAKVAGFLKVSEHKLAVAKTIKKSVQDGLFLFAMCGAAETIDIALAAESLDIIPAEIDGSPIDAFANDKLNYQNTFAFENFKIGTSAFLNSFSDIDYNQVNTPAKKEVTDFLLFEWSAKLDPIPTILNQNHSTRVKGFYGQTTCFNASRIKDGVVILGKSVDESVRYLYGTCGKGAFTFYGGHSPEDKSHFVGDVAPNMDLCRNSPGYRLILNNILFPSAKPEKKKT